MTQAGQRLSPVATQVPINKKLGERNLVKFFAVIGAAALVFQAYLYVRWVFSDNFRPVDPGPDPIPTYMRVVAWVLQTLLPVLFVWVLYRLVIRPYRREGRVPVEGVYFVAMLFIYFQNCSSGYFKPAWTWNTAMFNMGSWYNFYPGWQSAGGGRIAEPPLFGPLVFCVGMVVPAMAIVKIMNRLKARRPGWGPLKMWAAGFTMMCIFELMIEPILAIMGNFAFAGSIPELTLFEGKYYQFPIYEIFLFALWCPGAYVGLMYFRNDKGETIAERGLSNVKATPRKRAVLRFVAIVGAANLALTGYHATWMLTTLTPTYRMSEDIAFHRSYLRDEQCGGTTGIACPGYENQVAHRNH